jgi:hypothetical protein
VMVVPRPAMSPPTLGPDEVIHFSLTLCGDKDSSGRMSDRAIVFIKPVLKAGHRGTCL